MLFLTAYVGLILLDSFASRISPTLYFYLLTITFLPGPLILGYVSHISTRVDVHFKDFTFCLLPIMAALLCSDLLGGYPLFELVPRNAYELDSYIAMFNLISAMAGIHVLMYLIRSAMLIVQMKEDWSSYQSQTLPESWYDMIKVLVVMFVANITQVLSAFLNPTGSPVSIGDVGFMVLVFFFIYLTLRTTFRARKRGMETEPEIYTQDSYLIHQEQITAVEPDQSDVTDNVLKPIEDEQLFLVEDLSLSSLAQKLKMTPHRLSEILNSQVNKSFYEFVNDLRVEFAAERLLSEPEKSISEVFYSAGFSSKSTFYGYFKRTYNCTPSEYRKNAGE